MTNGLSAELLFALDFARYAGQGNLTFSPLSMRLAFGMLGEGARGNSLKQLAEVLRLPSGREWHYEVEDVIGLFNVQNDNYSLNMANGLWAEATSPVNAPFQQVLEQAYKAVAANANFTGNSEGERATINDWVYRNSGQRIKEILPLGSIDSMTRIVLANALSFSGKLERKFNPANTANADFFTENGGASQVLMMHQGDVDEPKEEQEIMQRARGSRRLEDVHTQKWQRPNFRYSNLDGVQAVRLPYLGGVLSKIDILPAAGQSVLNLEDHLRRNPRVLYEIIGEMEITPFASLQIARHKMNSRYELTEILPKMGVTDIFDMNAADLSGIMSGQLYVNVAIHGAEIEHTEEGSSGGAATVIGASRGAAPLPPEPVSLAFNRPYLELMMAGGNLLFYNRIMQP